MAFCTITDILNFIPGLRENATTDTSTSAIQLLVDLQYTKILSQAQYLGYTTAAFTTPTTNKQFLLFALNVEFPAAQLFLRRTGTLDPIVRKISLTQSDIAQERLAAFYNREFDEAFTQTLPTTALCSTTEVANFLSGYVPDATNDLGGPTTTTLQRWIDMESAYVYAIAAYLGYPLTSLTTNQALIYKKIVLNWVTAHLFRTRSEQFFGALNEQANIALINARQESRIFYNRDYDTIFLI